MEPIRRIQDILSASRQRTLIGLAGLPGSGKSTLAAELATEANALFGADVMVSLSMDGFHLSKAQLAAMPDPKLAMLRRGAPWTFDAAGLAGRLAEIRANAGTGTVTWPDFHHGTGDPVADHIAVSPAARVVLVEGLYLLYQSDGWSEVFKQFDERWYLDTPTDIALEQLTLRHMSSRSITRSEAERRIERNDKLNADLTFSTRQQSDWRVHFSLKTVPTAVPG